MKSNFKKKAQVESQLGKIIIYIVILFVLAAIAYGAYVAMQGSSSGLFSIIRGGRG